LFYVSFAGLGIELGLGSDGLGLVTAGFNHNSDPKRFLVVTMNHVRDDVTLNNYYTDVHIASK